MANHRERRSGLRCVLFTGCTHLAYHVPVVVGLALLPASTGGGLLHCNPNPQKTHSQLAVRSPCRALCFLGNLEKNEIRIEQRAVEWVFGIWGFLLGELDRRGGACSGWSR